MSPWIRLPDMAGTMIHAADLNDRHVLFRYEAKVADHAMRAPVSIVVPKRLIPMDLPRSCSGFSISGRTIRFSTKVPMVVPITTTSAPPTAGAGGGSTGDLEKSDLTGDQCIHPLDAAGGRDYLDLQTMFFKNARLRARATVPPWNRTAT